MKTRLYFAGQGSQGKQTIDKLGAERRLYAFCDKDTILKEPPHLYKESFLDSSAFSVWTGTVTIDIQPYAVFLLKNKNLFTVYANLDVIGNAKENSVLLDVNFYFSCPYGESRAIKKRFFIQMRRFFENCILITKSIQTSFCAEFVDCLFSL